MLERLFEIEQIKQGKNEIREASWKIMVIIQLKSEHNTDKKGELKSDISKMEE